MKCLIDWCDREATKRGRCSRCYQRWYDSPDFVRAPPPPPYVPPPDPVCPWCGPFTRRPGASFDVCPTCHLTADEHAYIDRILADREAVLRAECAAYRAQNRPVPVPLNTVRISRREML